MVERLQEIKDPSDRLEMAQELLRNYDEHIPQGIWTPYPDWDDLEIAEKIEGGRQFFDTLGDVLEPQGASIIAPLRARFEIQAAQMCRLQRMSSQARARTPSHEFAPYFGALDERIKASAGFPIQNKWDVRDIAITTERIGGGAFADVYKAHGSSGAYAVKVFFPMAKQRYVERMTGEFTRCVCSIMENVGKNRALIAGESYVRLRFVPDGGMWYVMDFCDAQSVNKMIHSIDYETKGRVLYTYATMLKSLHARGMVFVDNNWGAVLVNRDGVKICDYDLISSMMDIERVDHFARPLHVRQYASREQILDEPIRGASECESFALMIDELFFRFALETSEREQLGKARRNERKYVGERRCALPTHLQQVVTPLIQYPRDDSIAIDDFISAIKADFRL